MISYFSFAFCAMITPEIITSMYRKIVFFMIKTPLLLKPIPIAEITDVVTTIKWWLIWYV
jgi:hypothetical protein